MFLLLAARTRRQTTALDLVGVCAEKKESWLSGMVGNGRKGNRRKRSKLLLGAFGLCGIPKSAGIESWSNYEAVSLSGRSNFMAGSRGAASDGLVSGAGAHVLWASGVSRSGQRRLAALNRVSIARTVEAATPATVWTRGRTD
jgi:hypothetical protein